jgi:hypothetical protein
MSYGTGKVEPFSNAMRVFGCPTHVPMVTAFMAAVMMSGGIERVGAQSFASDTKVTFNLPAQPLSRALMAYSAVTGLEVFYNAALAEKQHSAEVVGVMTPSIALQILLRGTGYVARATGPGAFTIMATPRETAASAAAAAIARKRYEPYFAAIQARISDALCRKAEVAAARRELLFQFWVAPTGAVLRAQVIGDDGEPADDQTYAAAIRGLALAAPPAEMPQPINMVFFPPSGSSKACEAAAQRSAG